MGKYNYLTLACYPYWMPVFLILISGAVSMAMVGFFDTAPVAWDVDFDFVHHTPR